MINAKLILPVALSIATSLAGISFATNAGNRNMDTRSVTSVQQEERLSEKLEAGEITQEQYDEIIAAIESGEFAGHGSNYGKFGELTDEQKAEIAEKRAEIAESSSFGAFRGGMHGNSGVHNK